MLLIKFPTGRQTGQHPTVAASSTEDAAEAVAGHRESNSHRQLGKLNNPASTWTDLPCEGSVNDRDRPLVTGVNGPLMTRTISG